MKLRNKKTGEILDDAQYRDYSLPDGFGLRKDGNEWEYHSLAEFNADWEDYTPAEPLIKDEKVRKAVRAWAEAFDVEKIYYDAKMLRFHDSKCKTVIGIKHPILGVWDRKEPYTIAELCGEEGE